MLRIAQKPRLNSLPSALLGCTCVLRPIHLSAPLGSSAAAPKSTPRPSLAERIAARRSASAGAGDPPPAVTRTAGTADAPRRATSPHRASSIGNTTPRIEELVDSALAGLPRSASLRPSGSKGGRRRAIASEKNSPDDVSLKGEDKTRAHNMTNGKLAEALKSEAMAARRPAEKKPRAQDAAFHRQVAQERKENPLSLEQQKVRIEQRLGFLRDSKKMLLPWEKLSEEEQEMHAWKMEMSQEAKERNRLDAEEKAKAEREAADPSLATILGVPPPTPPPRPAALPRSESNGLPKESRRSQPTYQRYEGLARARHDMRRMHHAMELSAYELKLTKITERIKQQRALDAVAAAKPAAKRKTGPLKRAPQPSLLTTFAEKLSLDPSVKKTPKSAGKTTKEQLAADLNEVLPSKNMAEAGGVPYKRPARPSRNDRPASADNDAAPSNAFVAPPLSSHPHQISSSDVPFHPLPRDESVPIAKLSHNLTRVLFNPGVHFLRDPRSGVYNFPRRGLEDIPPVEQFEGEKMPEYITSSKDDVLNGLALTEGKTFVGSTSSTVAMLCQIYFWLSKGRTVNLGVLSAQWANFPADFSAGQRLPASVTLQHRDGHYAIDADKSMDATIGLNVLADYGHMMEKLLTSEPDEFERFLKTSSDPAPSQRDERQAYQYSTTDHMVLRSQLDAHDEHLPNVSFDVKTRGSVAVRMDRLNYVEAAGYDVHQLQGQWESFEREYYDLIRSAFLKYQFQARIGGMDGCFVAYHSTQRFFGFQYVSIPEMDIALFGSNEAGDQVFKLALGFLERILLKAKELYPDQSLSLTLLAGQANLDEQEDVLRVFVQPAQQDPSLPEAEKEITLLELRGVNYVDGVARERVDILPERTEEEAVDGELHIPVWQVGYDLTVSCTSSSPPTTASSDSDIPSQLPPSEIRRLYDNTRSFQTMFTSLTLPSNISRADVMAAAKRQAALAAQGEDLIADPSDLAVRFPMSEGMEYRSKPSRNVEGLRKKAVEGKRRADQREADEEGKDVVEIESSKKVWT